MRAHRRVRPNGGADEPGERVQTTMTSFGFHAPHEQQVDRIDTFDAKVLPRPRAAA
jgi:hypothetical protein